ncbi:BppU family phage baseplate upper protein [Lacticaseibacillus paracasei]|nr:BppU family phage baseplate upper protein [Lacticaseibacillus paracasei]
MAIRTYKVTLDTKNSIAPEPVFLRQGDKTGAVVIDAILMDNGAPVALDGLTPMFKANTADGQAVIADSTGFNVLDSANGEFTYKVPNALGAVPGKIKVAYFSFSDSSGTESTFDVAFVVKMAVDITQKQAEDYVTIIDGTIKSLSDKMDSMNSDIQTILNAYKQGDFYNKSETDSKDSATLSSAKSYADNGDSSTLTSAKSYADNGDSATLTSAKSYADKAGYIAPQVAATSQVSQVSGSPIEFWREGHTVFLQGSGNFPTSYSGVIWYIPEGFRPSKQQRISIQAQNAAFSILILQFNPSGETSIVFCTDTSQMWLTGVSWHTDDPMPS